MTDHENSARLFVETFHTMTNSVEGGKCGLTVNFVTGYSVVLVVFTLPGFIKEQFIATLYTVVFGSIKHSGHSL